MDLRPGRDAFNRGEFFEAHELWEDVWNEIDKPEWTWVQGLIQIATGLHKASNARWEAAHRSLSRALGRLADAPDVLDCVDVAGAKAIAERFVGAIDRRERPGTSGLAL